jgi:hypothetical protein
MAEPRRTHAGDAQKLADGRWEPPPESWMTVVKLVHAVPVDHEPFETPLEAIEHGTECAAQWSREHPHT